MVNAHFGHLTLKTLFLGLRKRVSYVIHVCCESCDFTIVMYIIVMKSFTVRGIIHKMVAFTKDEASCFVFSPFIQLL